LVAAIIRKHDFCMISGSVCEFLWMGRYHLLVPERLRRHAVPKQPDHSVISIWQPTFNHHVGVVAHLW